MNGALPSVWVVALTRLFASTKWCTRRTMYYYRGSRWYYRGSRWYYRRSRWYYRRSRLQYQHRHSRWYYRCVRAEGMWDDINHLPEWAGWPPIDLGGRCSKVVEFGI
jgi:hypothetical protein